MAFVHDWSCMVHIDFLNWHLKLCISKTMDSQGRKVIVCDNGTGVSK